MDTECPVRRHAFGMCDGRIRVGLSDYRDLDASDVLDDIGGEHSIAKVPRENIMRNKIDGTTHVVLYQLRDSFGAQSKFPMACHDFHAKRLTGGNHVRSSGP